MSQVFLSYRHVPPDEQLAERLCAFLEERGLRVFIDKRIRVGLDWVAEIERQLRASDAFIVFLSEDSIRSSMVRQEVKTAHGLRQEGKLAIFPVLLDLQGKLPYDLGSYLDRIQCALWHPGDSEAELFALLYAAITGGASLPVTPFSEDTAAISLTSPLVAAEGKEAPFPAAYPRIVMETGTIRPGSPFYVRRREDDIVEESLGGPSGTIMISGPLQTGKSSLLVRAHALAHKMGLRAVFIDFQKDFDEVQIASLSTTLRTLAQRIARALKTTVQPSDVWDSELLGDKASFAEFLEIAVLAKISGPFVLILNQVDRLFDRSYRGDFFAAVRGWHNNRATKEGWDSLHLILGHTTDPTLWIENLNESPFNIGNRLRLQDFTREQVEDLNVRYRRPLQSPKEVSDLMELVGGQPYLLRQALYALSVERWSLARLRKEAEKHNSPFENHLRRHLLALLQSDRLRAAVARIARGDGCDDEGLFQLLLASGLVAGESRSVARLRCALYQQYFSRYL